MKRWRLVLGVMAFLCLYATPVRADDCGSLTDCYNTLPAALAAAVSVGVLAGLNLVWRGVRAGVDIDITLSSRLDIGTTMKVDVYERLLGFIPVGWEDRNKSSLPAGISPDDYSPLKPGWHDYTTINMVPASAHITVDQMREYMLRFAVPNQDPSNPVHNGQISSVSDPRTGFPAGNVRTEVSDDGLTISNTTLPGHVFYDGRIVRTASQNGDGSWSIVTHGYGNNVGLGLNIVNQLAGPGLFNTVDEQMIAYILRTP